MGAGGLGEHGGRVGSPFAFSGIQAGSGEHGGRVGWHFAFSGIQAKCWVELCGGEFGGLEGLEAPRPLERPLQGGKV